MVGIAFKIYYALYRVVLFFLFNINHNIYMNLYINLLKKAGVHINGRPRFIHFNVFLDSTEQFSLIELNDNCVITGNTAILTHDYSIWHASVGTNRISRNSHEFMRKGKVVVEENAFIGMNSIILPNVVIGKNAIVGAGSVVTKDVKENTIVAGNPARYLGDINEYVEKYLGCMQSGNLVSK